MTRDFKTFLVRVPVERCFICDAVEHAKPRQLAEPSVGGALECVAWQPAMGRVWVEGSGGASFSVCGACTPRAESAVRAALEALRA